MAVKASKKRRAPSESNPVSKKPNLNSTDVKPASEQPSRKKRSRPVTQTAAEDDGDTSQEELDDGDYGKHELEDDQAILDDGEGAQTAARESAGVGGRKHAFSVMLHTNELLGSREAHRAQKALLTERKAARVHGNEILQAKKLWNLARQKDITKDVREKHVLALMGVVRGKIQEVVFKHDASRIVQTLVKYGDQEQRDEIANELKGKYRDLSVSKYSKFLVTKLIRHCPKHRTAILQEFNGHIIRLLLHREATSVIADAFELYANAFERAFLVREFYGKEVSLFTSEVVKKGSAISDYEKEGVRRGLKGVLAGADEGRRKRILASTKENLESIFNNPDKGAVSHAIVHRALLEFLLELTDSAEDEKLRHGIFERCAKVEQLLEEDLSNVTSCQELMADMIHTKDGSRAVREFIVRGTAKDRKHIVKILKPHIERICSDDEAQFVLFTALDVIDDTKMTAKYLVNEVSSRAPILYKHPQGRRSLLYLIVPRSPRHFTPAQIAIIADTDHTRDLTSKKAVDIRQEEVNKAASGPLLAVIAEEGRAETMLRDPGGSLVITEVLLHTLADKSEAMKALLHPLILPYPSLDPLQMHLIDVPHASRTYKALLQGGQYSHREQKIQKAALFSPAAFATMWIDIVGEERTLAMALGGGTFVVAALFERIKEEGTESDKDSLRRFIEIKAREAIRQSTSRGKDVLLASIVDF